MDFENWLATNNYDGDKLTDPQRRHLEAAWRSETGQYPTAKLAGPGLPPEIIAGLVAEYASLNPAKAAAVREIGERAIAENWDAREARLQMLRESRKHGDMIITPRPTSVGGSGAEVMGVALALTAGVKEEVLLKSTRPEVMEAARHPHLRGFSYHGLVRNALAAAGEHVGGRINEVHVKRAFAPHGQMFAGGPSTSSIPDVLSNIAGKVLLGSYMMAPSPWRTFAAVRSVANFKTHTGVRPTFTVPMEKVPPGGEIKHGTIGDETISYNVDTYASQLDVDRQNIIDDDTGALMDALQGLARGAARKLNDLVATAILANAGSFWATANNNYFEGAGTALSATSLGDAVELLRKMKDAEGNLLDLEPAVLLVPADLEVTARGLLESIELLRTTTDGLPTGNIFRGLAQLAVDPRLGDSSFSGSSTTAWYLFSSPSNAAVVVAFLDGQQVPTLETFDFSHDKDRLAMAWRCYHDFGAALGDFRASIKSKGAA
jgi:hypothetical protein